MQIHWRLAGDFKTLAATFRKVAGRFLMSINDHCEVRHLFAGFQIRPVSLKYSAGHPAAANRKAQRQELLISNY
jgi:DNA adenine methylase